MKFWIIYFVVRILFFVGLFQSVLASEILKMFVVDQI